MFSDVFITLTQAPPTEVLSWWKDPALVGLIGAVIGAMIGGVFTFAVTWFQQRGENNRINRSWKREGIQQFVTELIQLRNDVHSCKQAMRCASPDSLPSFFAPAYQASSERIAGSAEPNGYLRETVSWRWPWRSSLEVLVELYLPGQRELLKKLDSEVSELGTRLNEIQNYASRWQDSSSPAQSKGDVFECIGQSSKQGCSNADLATEIIEQLMEHLRCELIN